MAPSDVEQLQCCSGVPLQLKRMPSQSLPLIQVWPRHHAEPVCLRDLPHHHRGCKTLTGQPNVHPRVLPSLSIQPHGVKKKDDGPLLVRAILFVSAPGQRLDKGPAPALPTAPATATSGAAVYRC